MRLGPKVMFLSSIIIKFRCYCHLSNSCEDWSLGISRKPFLWPKERRYQNRTNDHRITNILFKVKVVNKKIFKSFKQWKLVQSTTNITTTTTTIPEVSVGFEPGIWRKSSWEHHSKWALVIFESTRNEIYPFTSPFDHPKQAMLTTGCRFALKFTLRFCWEN